jgi:hypothetical protein
MAGQELFSPVLYDFGACTVGGVGLELVDRDHL